MTAETQERATHGERISYLEGTYGHLATKADLAALESRMTWRLIAVGVFVIAAITAIDRLWG